MLLQILSVLLATIIARVVWRRYNYDLHKVPSPPGLPLLGHTLEFIFGQPNHQMSKWTSRCLKQLGYPRLMRVDLMGQPWLLVTDVDFMRDVMFSKTAPFPRAKDPAVYIVGNDKSAKTLTTSTTVTPYVKAVRRVYANALQSANLKVAVPKLAKVIDTVIEMIESKRGEGAIDFQSLFVRMTLDFIGVLAFDTNLGGLDGSRGMYHSLLQTGYVARGRLSNPLNKLRSTLFPMCEQVQKEEAIINGLNSEWEELTREILKRPDPPDGEQHMWSALRSLEDPETGKRLSYNSLLSEVAGAVLAGTDTTGHQLGWLFALLAGHPTVVETLLNELRVHRLYGANARDLAFEDLGELTYLSAIIKEGMRIAHIGPTSSFLRVVPRDMTILGYRVPKNTVILCPAIRGLDSPEWGDPQVFRPERWLTDEDMSRKFAHPFSMGPRDCIGQRLAILEMRLVIIMLFTRYQFSLTMKLDDILKNAQDGFVIEAQGGLWLNVKPRPVEI